MPGADGAFGRAATAASGVAGTTWGGGSESSAGGGCAGTPPVTFASGTPTIVWRVLVTGFGVAGAAAGASDGRVPAIDTTGAAPRPSTVSEPLQCLHLIVTTLPATFRS